MFVPTSAPNKEPKRYKERLLMSVGKIVETVSVSAIADCQGHSHPKLLVALDVGSKSSADKIQPTAHRPTGYGQYSGVVPWPLNNDGRCYVKLRSV